jgi:hypothetical protein
MIFFFAEVRKVISIANKLHPTFSLQASQYLKLCAIRAYSLALKPFFFLSYLRLSILSHALLTHTRLSATKIQIHMPSKLSNVEMIKSMVH